MYILRIFQGLFFHFIENSRTHVLIDFLHKSKIVEGFLEETNSSTAAYIDVCEERRKVSTTKSPTRATYAGSLICTLRLFSMKIDLIFTILISMFIITNNLAAFASSPVQASNSTQSQNSPDAEKQSAIPQVKNEKLFTIQDQYISQCTDEILDKDSIIVSWSELEPYQFSYINKKGKFAVTGLDIELINIIGNKLGMKLRYLNSPWEKAISNVESGKSDIVAGATFTEQRAAYANYSVPYRFEEISLFVLNSGIKYLNFNTVNEFLAQLRLLNFRLAIIKGFVYGDNKITTYLNDAANNDIIFKYDDDTDLLNALIHKEVDGFLANRIVGVALALSNNTHNNEIQEIPTGIQTPIHLMFNKTTISLDTVEQINHVMEGFINSEKYKKIVKNYLYYVLLPKAIDSTWCYIIGFIGSIAFAISSTIIAARKNDTFFTTFLLAILPSIIGCILLDITLNQTYNTPFTLTQSYIFRVFITILIGFVLIRLLDYYNKQKYEDNFVSKIWNNTIIVCDALGQAFFMVIGVVIVMIQNIEPLEFWGPCFAFLTSSSGIIIRNLIFNSDKSVSSLSKEINIEIYILWGFIFAKLLDLYAYNPNYNTIKYSIMSVIAGAFVSRLLVHYYNIPNLTFHSENVAIANIDKTNLNSKI